MTLVAIVNTVQCLCEQRYKIVSAEVEPTDDECDWPSDPDDSLSVSKLHGTLDHL